MGRSGPESTLRLVSYGGDMIEVQTSEFDSLCREETESPKRQRSASHYLGQQLPSPSKFGSISTAAAFQQPRDDGVCGITKVGYLAINRADA